MRIGNYSEFITRSLFPDLNRLRRVIYFQTEFCGEITYRWLSKAIRLGRQAKTARGYDVNLEESYSLAVLCTDIAPVVIP